MTPLPGGMDLTLVLHDYYYYYYLPPTPESDTARTIYYGRSYSKLEPILSDIYGTKYLPVFRESRVSTFVYVCESDNMTISLKFPLPSM